MGLPFDKALSGALNILNPANSTGKTLMALNALSIAFAAASNTFAAATDKNTSAEDKKFLVPAGGATGVANVAIYLGMTNKLIDNLSGSFANKVVENMQKNGTFETAADTFINSQIVKTATKVKNTFTGLLGKPKNTKLLDDMKETLKNQDGTITPYAKNLFKKSISQGFGVLGAFIGAVVGCAIITPILRDISAYAVQRAREKNDPSLKDKPYRPYFDISHIRTGKHPYGKSVNSKQPLSMASYMTFTNERTKI